MLFAALQAFPLFIRQLLKDTIQTSFCQSLFSRFLKFFLFSCRPAGQLAYTTIYSRFCQEVFYNFSVLFLVVFHCGRLSLFDRFALISDSAPEASPLVSSLLARSPRLTMPQRRPFSSTGRRRICWRPMRCAAVRVSISGSALTTFLVITSRTVVWAGFLPEATQRITRSRSVTTP